MENSIRTISANGLIIPVLGQGGWRIGDDPKNAQSETDALNLGIDLGMNLIDTAEMYGEGKSEELIGTILMGRKREDYILVSKVYPHNAGRQNIFKSCENSLKRLKTDYLDLYLLHWRGVVPLEETVDCMEILVKSGKIRRWGVSNFDVSDMEELWTVPNGKNCAVNQVLYNLTSRGIEFDLIPWLEAHNVAVMAYCPLAQGGELRRMNYDPPNNPVLLNIAQKYRVSVMQILLAFVLKQKNVCAIPKAGTITHVRANAEAAKLTLSTDDFISAEALSSEEWAEIDAEFPPPNEKMHLDIE